MAGEPQGPQAARHLRRMAPDGREHPPQRRLRPRHHRLEHRHRPTGRSRSPFRLIQLVPSLLGGRGLGLVWLGLVGLG